MLKNGVSVGFAAKSWIYVDLDGPNKGFNTFGRDVFKIPVSSEGNLSFLSRNSLTSGNVTACRSGNSIICASWVMEFDNNDYVRCTGLSYNGNTTCK